MKYLHHVIIFLSLPCLFSCASDIVDMTGGIKGTVKDASNNASIEGCLVTLTPTNRSTTTNTGGVFLFDELENNTYSLTFTKDGYESQTRDLTVTTGKVANVDIQLKKPSQSISVNPESLNFGDLETTKELYLSKDGGNNTQYSVKANQTWINVNPSSGTLGNTNVKITVVIDRNGLSDGEYNGTVTITSSFGEKAIPVFMSKAEFSVPQVANGEKGYDVTETSFKINGTILKTGGNEIIEHGHCWSKKENPTIADSKTNLGNTKEIGEFTSTISGNIVAGETYYVRAYARNTAGIAYSSNSVSVTIPKTTKPTVVTSVSKNVTTNSAAINGSIMDTGNGKVTECGFYYGKTDNPTTKVACSSVTTDFSYNLSSLTEGTTYYYKAYAKNEKGESCGDVVSFTTSIKTSKPTVVTSASKNVTTNSAAINGSITDTGNGKVTECGFYYGKTDNPTTKVTCSSVTTDFSYNLSSLTEGTTYYYKAYAKNEKGESCGDVMSFTTSSSTSEGTSERSVTTGEATNITYSSVTLKASVSGEFKGAKEVAEYGFYIGNNQYQLQKKTATNLSGGSFDLTIDKLNPENKYYYYAYVLCYDRTELKGELKSFTTLQKPKITSGKYSAKKTVDDKLWLTLTATVNPAGLQIVDAGFLMGNVHDGDNLHSSYNKITIVPCEFQDNTVTYDGLAKDYLNYLSSDKGTYIIPYFVFEDGTEVYTKREYLYDGQNIEKQY